MKDVDWKADPWFATHHADRLTADFKAWWLGVYGPPDQYAGDEMDEYWVRCTLAWQGWDAAIFSTLIPKGSGESTPTSRV